MLALSGKIPTRKQQFIVSIKDFEIISASNLMNFGGIVSKPTDFLTSISFKIFLTSGGFICWKFKLFKSEANLF